ncbi:unknown protein [Microcystis aeruginosa NIES-843]|uniref:Uncharacterized protein n=1 Tax=Microcystis aeruginosa (strain NIES-843 / IAM M-2473) TaxID=449447 RepID=B0JKX2_MICAN|nr:unknown protein [Microcystis aeruginosa NIES-843]
MELEVNSLALESGLFQSLIGFKINWNILMLTRLVFPCLFQSLIGFKINWNTSWLLCKS